ncbi:MAG: dihydroorotase [Acidithiobacillus ferrivorans]|uniref:Dihydroorotase n=1 Tax=Acidithiobacillus ferrivorans TaxID=160808 RepID=A0A257SLP9_9PROT|nr:MAG: dihydroorotase [Acidithiobacillus ferrivorans]
MRRLLRGAHIIDPATGFDAVADLAIAGGRILARGQIPGDFMAEEVVDGSGLVACPGLVEMALQAHTPGHGRDGDLASELRAAVAGGVVHVALSPDTDPCADTAGVIHQQRAMAAALGLAKVYPTGALTRQLAGEALSEMATLQEAGAVAFSQGGRAVSNGALLRLALAYAADFALPVLLHSEDALLAADGVMHEGALSVRLGLAGRTAIAEQVGVMRDLAIAQLVDCPVHLRHLSTMAALDAVQAARRWGQQLTADVSIHHLLLTEQDVGLFNTRAKVLPPLRPGSERDALRQALAKGQIDAISSDHCPWGMDRMGQTFAQAPFGIAAVELLLPLTLRLVDEGVVDLATAIGLLTTGPARALGLPTPSLAPGAPADLCIFAADQYFVVDPRQLVSRGKNLPYGQWELRGKVRYTLVDGHLVYRA